MLFLCTLFPQNTRFMNRGIRKNDFITEATLTLSRVSFSYERYCLLLWIIFGTVCWNIWFFPCTSMFSSFCINWGEFFFPVVIVFSLENIYLIDIPGISIIIYSRQTHININFIRARSLYAQFCLMFRGKFVYVTQHFYHS